MGDQAGQETHSNAGDNPTLGPEEANPKPKAAFTESNLTDRLSRLARYPRMRRGDEPVYSCGPTGRRQHQALGVTAGTLATVDRELSECLNGMAGGRRKVSAGAQVAGQLAWLRLSGGREGRRCPDGGEDDHGVGGPLGADRRDSRRSGTAAQGWKVRQIGCSNFTLEQLAEADDTAQREGVARMIASLQNGISLRRPPTLRGRHPGLR